MPFLLITLNRAENLIVADKGGTSDPYVVFGCGDCEVQSTVKEGTLNPVWNDDLLMPVLDIDEPLTVELFDKDRVNKDDSLGSTKTRIDQLVMGRPKESWLNLKKGRINLSLTAIGFGVDPLLEGVVKETQKKLIVSIVKCENITALDRSGTSDAFCRVFFPYTEGMDTTALLNSLKKGSTITTPLIKSTAVIKKNLNPQWNETFAFTVEDDTNEQIKIEMFDKDLTKEKFIAEYIVKDLHKLTRDRTNTVDVQMVKKDGKPDKDKNKLLLVLIPSGFGEEPNLADEYNNKDQRGSQVMDVGALALAHRSGHKSFRVSKKKKSSKKIARAQLKVTVLEATGQLPDAAEMQGIVRLHFEDNHTQTEEDDDYENPFWNENFTFDCEDPDRLDGVWITFELCDGDRPLGYCKYDVSSLYQGNTSDLYIPLRVMGEPVEFRTTVKEGQDVTWDESFNFELGLSADRLIEFDIWDKDTLNHDFMGSCNFNIKEHIFNSEWTGGVVERWFPLKRKGRKAGEILLNFTPMGENYGKAPADMQVTVKRARKLLKMDHVGDSDPFVQVKLHNATTDCKLHVYLTPNGFGRLTAEQQSEKDEQDRMEQEARGNLKGTLQVIAISGRDLMVADANGKSDPFLELWMSNDKRGTLQKTKVIKKTLEPVWNQTFRLLVQNYEKNILEIECWDKDLVGRDTLGIGEIVLSDVEQGKEWDVWVPLSTQGDIHLKLLALDCGRVQPKYIPPELRPPPKLKKEMFCKVRVIEAWQLLEEGETGNFSLTCTLEDSDQDTPIIMDTTNPRWRQTFEFMIDEESSTMTMEIFSHEKGTNKKTLVGKYELPLMSLGEEEFDGEADLWLPDDHGDWDPTGGKLKFVVMPTGFGDEGRYQAFLEKEKIRKEDFQLKDAYKKRKAIETNESKGRSTISDDEQKGWDDLAVNALESRAGASAVDKQKLVQLKERQATGQGEGAARTKLRDEEDDAFRDLINQFQGGLAKAKHKMVQRVQTDQNNRGKLETKESMERKRIEEEWTEVIREVTSEKQKDWETAHAVCSHRLSKKINVEIFEGHDLLPYNSKPMLELAVGLDRQHTPAATDTRHPQWNHGLEFRGVPEDGSVEINVVDKVTDQRLGGTLIPVDKLATGQNTFYLPLANVGDALTQPAGVVKLNITPCGIGNPELTNAKNRLCIFLADGRLPGRTAKEPIDAVIRITVGSQMYLSNKQTSFEPLWNEFAQMIIPDKDKRTMMKVEVFDHASDGQLVGKTLVPLDGLSEHANEYHLRLLRGNATTSQPTDLLENAYVHMVVSPQGFKGTVPQKTLSVNILEGANIHSTTKRALAPYVWMQLDGAERQTASWPLGTTPNPSWNESFTFVVHDRVIGMGTSIRAEVRDAASHNRTLGHATLFLPSLRHDTREKQLDFNWYDEENHRWIPHANSGVSVNCKLESKGDIGAPSASLDVQIVSAENLPSTQKGVPVVPSVTAKLGAVMKSTSSTKSAGSNASWKQTLTFPVPDTRRSVLQLELNHNCADGPVLLGNAKIKLSQLRASVVPLNVPLLQCDPTTGEMVPTDTECKVSVTLKPNQFHTDPIGLDVHVKHASNLPSSFLSLSSQPTVRLSWGPKQHVSTAPATSTSGRLVFDEKISMELEPNDKLYETLSVQLIDSVSQRVIGEGAVTLNGIASADHEVSVPLTTLGLASGELTVILTPFGFGNEQKRLNSKLSVARGRKTHYCIHALVGRVRNLVSAITDYSLLQRANLVAHIQIGSGDYLRTAHTSRYCTLSSPVWDEMIKLDVMSSELNDGIVAVLLRDGEDDRSDVLARTAFPLFNLAATENDIWLPLQFWDGYAGKNGSWQVKGEAEIQLRVTPDGFGDKEMAKRLELFKTIAYEFTMKEQLGRIVVEKEEATRWQEVLGKDTLSKTQISAAHHARLQHEESVRRQMLERMHIERTNMQEFEFQQRQFVETLEAEAWGYIMEERARLAEEAVQRQRQREATARREWEAQRQQLQQRHEEFTKEVEWEKYRVRRFQHRELERESQHQKELKTLIRSGRSEEAQQLIHHRDSQRRESYFHNRSAEEPKNFYNSIPATTSRERLSRGHDSVYTTSDESYASPPQSATAKFTGSFNNVSFNLNNMCESTGGGGDLHEKRHDDNTYNASHTDPNNFHYGIQDGKRAKYGTFEATIGNLWACRADCAEDQIGPMYSDLNVDSVQVSGKHNTFKPINTKKRDERKTDIHSNTYPDFSSSGNSPTTGTGSGAKSYSSPNFRQPRPPSHASPSYANKPANHFDTQKSPSSAARPPPLETHRSPRTQHKPHPPSSWGSPATALPTIDYHHASPSAKGGGRTPHGNGGRALPPIDSPSTPKDAEAYEDFQRQIARHDWR